MNRPFDVVFATFRRIPELWEDEAGLGDACSRAGLRWRAVPWDDPGFEWASTGLVVVRSTWDYWRRRDAFLAWTRHVAAVTRLMNPAATLARNTEKSYLLDLASRGVPVVPTVLVEPSTRTELHEILASRDWDDAIVKPAISAGGWRTFRVRRHAPSHDDVRARRLLRTRRSLVQPFLPGVLERGERALVYVDGAYSHAIRKRSIFDPPGDLALPVEPESDEMELARMALAAEGAGGLLYARVDIVRDPGGRALLIELELTEPRLFLASAGAAAAERLAAAIARRLDEASETVATP